MSSAAVIYDWLSKRNITPSIQKEFDVRSGNHPSLGECIVIPVHDHRHQFVFNKYRRSPLREDGPKYIYDKGGEMTLYGYWKAADSDTVLITEGELDCLVAWSANIPAVSSTGGAMSFPNEWAEFFLHKNTVICFDNDKAGGEGMVRVLKILPQAKVLFLPDKPGVKDITDYVAHGGDLHELMKTAKQFNDYQSVVSDRAERLATWKSTHFHDAYIKAHAEKPKTKRERLESDEVKRARSYRIDELVKFNGNGNARCLWHAETEASLHYYPEDNHVYCFGGCGRGYDAIDVYRKLHNCTFREAIKALQ